MFLLQAYCLLVHQDLLSRPLALLILIVQSGWIHIMRSLTILSEDDYKAHLRQGGKPAIPSLSIFTVKMKNGIPTRAKCRIIALGNKEVTSWTKADCMLLLFCCLWFDY